MINDPGEMRHRGTLQSLTPTADEGGGNTIVLTAVANIACKVESLGGNEQLRAMAVGVMQPHRIGIRYRAGVVAKMQFVEHHPEGDRTHDITSVRDQDGKRRYLELLTEWAP